MGDSIIRAFSGDLNGVNYTLQVLDRDPAGSRGHEGKLAYSPCIRHEPGTYLILGQIPKCVQHRTCTDVCAMIQSYTFNMRQIRKLTVLLSEDEFALLEKYCKERGHKKSTLAARLIRDHLKREGVTSQRTLFASNEKSERGN